jgi:hypothetical protein
MKTTCFIFLTISWAACTPGIGYAVPSNPASQPASPPSSANTASGRSGDAGHAAPADDGRYRSGAKASLEPRGHGRPSITHHPSSRATLTRVNRPKQLANNRQRFVPGYAVQPPSREKSPVVGKGGLTSHEAVHKGSLVRVPSVARPTAPALNNVRHRSPNPAVVVGSVNSARRNNGAIDGTHMNRRM